ELPQSEDREDDHRQRECDPAGSDDRDREDDPGDRDHHPGGGLGHLGDQARAPLLPALLRRRGASARLLCLGLLGLGFGYQRLIGVLLPPAAPELERGRVDVLEARHLAPKRRWRSSYSSRAAWKASRLKSGQSSSRKTNSE